MSRNSTERLGGKYHLEPRGSAFFPVHGVNTALPSIYKKMWHYASIKRVVFCLISCTAVQHLIHSFVSLLTNCAFRVMVFDSTCIS